MIKNIGNAITPSHNFTCQYCHKEFRPKDSSPSHLKKHQPKYCSKPCWDKAQKQIKQVNCAACGESLQREPYRLRRNRYNFCDTRCHGG